MGSTKCLVCGSSNMRADRALSGRLVCNSCGTPFGVGRQGNSKISNYNNFSFDRGKSTELAQCFGPSKRICK